MINKTNNISAMVKMLTVLSLLTVLWSATNASAHGGATGVVKQRMDAMSEMADAMKSMALVIKGKQDFEPELFIANGKIIVGHSNRLPTLFPKGITQASSEAVPAIWQQWDKFTDISERTKTSAQKLVTMAHKGAALRPLTKQFVKLSSGCKACHKDYRKKK